MEQEISYDVDLARYRVNRQNTLNFNQLFDSHRVGVDEWNQINYTREAFKSHPSQFTELPTLQLLLLLAAAFPTPRPEESGSIPG